MNKEITLLDAEKFWSYLDKEHPELSAQLPQRALVNGSIVSFQPAKMKQEDYNAYLDVLYNWQINNGFWDELTIVTNDNQKVTFLRTDMIKMDRIDDFSTLVTIKEQNKGVEEYEVSENMDVLRKRLYI